jgi:hypothetical protein
MVIVEHRFAEFVPEMSLCSISVSSLISELMAMGSSLPTRCIDDVLRRCLAQDLFPYVRFIDTRSEYPNRPDLADHERIDFFGFCESDWRFGFTVIVPQPLDGKTFARKEYDTELGRKYGFFAALISLFDPQIEDPAPFVLLQDGHRFDVASMTRRLQMETRDKNFMFLVLPEEVRQHIRII